MKKSTMVNGASGGWTRHEADFYPTPDDCTTALINAVPSLLTTGVIWEPACGDGAISKLLTQRGATVVSTDLHDRGFGMVGVDFLKARNVFGAKTIITNPPFILAEDFIRHATNMGVYVAMLLKGTYWHSTRRLKLFEDTRPAMVLPMTWRPNFAPDRGKSPMMEFCWTVWGAGPSSRCEHIPLRKPS